MEFVTLSTLPGIIGRYLMMLKVTDILDIAIMVFVFYKALTLIQSTRAASLLKGVLVFLAALMLAVPAMHVQAAQTDGANDSLRKVKVGYLIYQGYQEGEDDAPESGYGYEYLQQIAYYAGWEYELVFYCIAYQQLVQWINFDKSPLCGSVIW